MVREVHRVRGYPCLHSLHRASSLYSQPLKLHMRNIHLRRHPGKGAPASGRCTCRPHPGPSEPGLCLAAVAMSTGTSQGLNSS